jgi:hypothetical protein
MSDLLIQYKAFWKQVKSVVAENGFTGFHITFSGCGDNGQIDEVNTFTGNRSRRLSPRQAAIEAEIDTDAYGNSMRPHPWLHDTETFESLQDSDLVIPNVKQTRELFVENEGWKTEEFVGDMPLIDVVKTMAYDVAATWFGSWETDEGSNGVLYFYPKYIEFEYTEYYEKENEQGHKCYSETVRFKDFEDWDYDVGYRGFCIDAIYEE